MTKPNATKEANPMDTQPNQVRSMDEAPAEWVDPARLKPWGNNPRKNDHAVEKVAASMLRFGFGAPIVARRANDEIIAGHTRWKAAIKVGMKRVPVRYLDIGHDEAHLLALADNKTSELALWDDDVLAAVIGDLQAKSLDMFDGTGFSFDEINRLAEGPAFEPASPEEQGALDKRATVTCPECGHEFPSSTAR